MLKIIKDNRMLSSSRSLLVDLKMMMMMLEEMLMNKEIMIRDMHR
jgi:hypothetical protein